MFDEFFCFFARDHAVSFSERYEEVRVVRVFVVEYEHRVEECCSSHGESSLHHGCDRVRSVRVSDEDARCEFFVAVVFSDACDHRVDVFSYGCLIERVHACSREPSEHAVLARDASVGSDGVGGCDVSCECDEVVLVSSGSVEEDECGFLSGQGDGSHRSGRCAWISARCGSSHGGSTRLSPGLSSSIRNPGPFVAISKRTPDRSRK